MEASNNILDLVNPEIDLNRGGFYNLGLDTGDGSASNAYDLLSEDEQTFLTASSVLHERIENNLIKSAHDVSLGGIITAVVKMCIKGNKGINIKKPKYLINEIEYLFAEDQGRYIIEINKKDFKKVADILHKNAVHFDELGTINENELYINDKTKVTIDELSTSNKSWLTNYMSK